MVCARCDFHAPNASGAGQLVEARHHLQRMLVDVPLTDDERAAAEDGQAAVDQLLGRLGDIAAQPDRPHGELRAETR